MKKLLKTAVSVTPKFLGVLSLVAGLSFSSGANANITVPFGQLAVGGFVDLGNHSVGTGLFTDKYTFTLASAGTVLGGADAIQISMGAINMSGITDFLMGIYDSSNTLVSNTGTDITASNLSATGSYYAQITGFGTGKLGGKYSAALMITPVPEAETYAMMLAGLGLLGLISRRRKNASTSLDFA